MKTLIIITFLMTIACTGNNPITDIPTAPTEANQETGTAQDPNLPLPQNSAPIAGHQGHITTAGKSLSSITIQWHEASDDRTSAANLEYLVVYALNSNIASYSAAMSNGSVALNWKKQTIMCEVTGLNNGTLYYFKVFVRDAHGAITGYNLYSDTTAFDTAPPKTGVISWKTVGVELSWSISADNVTPQNRLKYKLVYSKTTNTVSTLKEAETQASIIMDWTTHVLSKNVLSIIQNHDYYYFAVIVKDEAGNKTLYPFKHYYSPPIVN